MKLFKMRSALKSLAVLGTLCASTVNCISLDREAFTVTNYDLNLQVDPELHRLGVRGKITLRNDSTALQKIAVLQISSSLDWRSIKADDKALQYLTQPYTSDIDHTGGLSEAIITLPQAITSKATIELEIAYEGVIVLDATRLTRIGTPEEAAKSTDWDRIDPKFVGLRGAGYVGWYPIATDVANLSEGNSLFEVLARWREKEAGSAMRLGIELSQMSGSGLKASFNEDGSVRVSGNDPEVLFNAIGCAPRQRKYPGNSLLSCSPQPLRLDAPTLLIADYQVLERTGIEVRYLSGHNVAAANFADAAEKTLPLITDWFGPQRERAKVADLPDLSAAPFESGALLLTPLANTDSKLAGLAAAHQLTHAAFLSFRPWIEEGLAHFAQALYLEQQRGRQTALDYMGLHRSAFAEAEKITTVPRSDDEVTHSLVNTASEELYRSKAMYVWWMLRDMIGDAALKKALAAYHAEEDKDPSYMPRLIAAQTQRDLGWFFDDWVYRDRGLPDFKVESAFSTKSAANTFLLTVTVGNLGGAGAEVPVTVKFAGGEIAKRLEVRAKSKASIRVETPAPPQEIVVNDGSVPESDLTNNVFKIEPAQK